MAYLFILFCLIVVFSEPLAYLWRKLSRSYKNKVNFLGANYINAKAFYVYLFNEVPNVHFFNNIDTNGVFGLMKEKYGNMVHAIFQDNSYNYNNQQMEFDTTLYEMKHRVLLDLSDGYASIYYPCKARRWLDDLVNDIAALKATDKEQEHEINIIVNTQSGLELRNLPIKPVKLEIDKFYNDDFAPVHKIVLERLTKENDKGIVLLHGLPGTGKTTYLRHLIGSTNKRVLFVSPTVAENLTGPAFLDLLIEYPNSVLVIEDAENIIMDRKANNSSGVSNLLNLSDGLLSDCLNVQIICTFNNALSMIDSALMRKGRLIAEYHFDKLHVNKARELAQHLGLDLDIRRPMTLAEITNADKQDFDKPQAAPIGFKSWALDEIEA